MINQFPEINEKLKQALKPSRYEHTLGVAYTAANMAMVYDVDIHQAFLAGLLHDCAKCIPDEEALAYCNTHGISVSDYEANHLYLLHAKVGAYMAEEVYHVTDKAILDAIFWHTTGTRQMSSLAQILYVADYIEPGRKDFPGLKDARRAAFGDLNYITALVLHQSYAYLTQRHGDAIDENTKIAYAYYKHYLQ
jgi:predicted HD superfamily hydrolase involved in NAD metabolism